MGQLLLPGNAVTSAKPAPPSKVSRSPGQTRRHLHSKPLTFASPTNDDSCILRLLGKCVLAWKYCLIDKTAQHASNFFPKVGQGLAWRLRHLQTVNMDLTQLQGAEQCKTEGIRLCSQTVRGLDSIDSKEALCHCG